MIILQSLTLQASFSFIVLNCFETGTSGIGRQSRFQTHNYHMDIIWLNIRLVGQSPFQTTKLLHTRILFYALHSSTVDCVSACVLIVRSVSAHSKCFHHLAPGRGGLQGKEEHWAASAYRVDVRGDIMLIFIRMLWKIFSYWIILRPLIPKVGLSNHIYKYLSACV